MSSRYVINASMRVVYVVLSLRDAPLVLYWFNFNCSLLLLFRPNRQTNCRRRPIEFLLYTTNQNVENLVMFTITNVTYITETEWKVFATTGLNFFLFISIIVDNIKIRNSFVPIVQISYTLIIIYNE